MPFQRVNLFQNYNLRIYKSKCYNAGFIKDDKNKDECSCKFFPRTFYRYNNKVYKADNSVLEYDKSTVFKRLINIDNDKDTVLFYDKKTFDTSVERFKSYSRKGTSRGPSGSASSYKKCERTVENNDRLRTSERSLRDEDIADMFNELFA